MERLKQPTTPRDLANKITRPIAIKLHEKLPNLSPNNITMLGLIGTSASLMLNYYAQKKENNNLKTIAGISYLTSSLADALDGALARYILEQGENHNTKIGQLVDVGADRAAEIFAAIARILHAKETQQKFGVLAAGIAGITNLFPSYFRAKAEALEKNIPESGKDTLSFLGTRAGRLVTTTISNFFPEIKNKPVQPVLDSLTTIANLKTTVERVKIVHNKEASTILSEDKINMAKEREKMLKFVSILGIGIIGLFTALNLKTQKKP